jgi:hypothetical protein
MGTLDRILRFAGFGRKKNGSEILKLPKDWAPDSDYFKSLTTDEYSAMIRQCKLLPEHDRLSNDQWDALKRSDKAFSSDVHYHFSLKPMEPLRGRLGLGYHGMELLHVDLISRVPCPPDQALIRIGYAGDDYFVAKVNFKYEEVNVGPGGKPVDVYRAHHFRCDGRAGVERLLGAVAGHIRQGSGWYEPVDLHGRPLVAAQE